MPRLTLAQARDEWFFIAHNDRPPSVRIALLLEHAARIRPREPIPITVIAMITFALPREPYPNTPIVEATRNQLRSAERQLTARGRALLRCRRGVRASVDADDVRETIAPRRLARALSGVRALIERFERISPSDLDDPQLREEAVAMLQDIPEDFLTFEHRAFRRAWISAAEGGRGEFDS